MKVSNIIQCLCYIEGHLSHLSYRGSRWSWLAHRCAWFVNHVFKIVNADAFHWDVCCLFHHSAPPSNSLFTTLDSHSHIPRSHQRQLNLWTSLYFAYLRTEIRVLPILSYFPSTISSKRHPMGRKSTRKLAVLAVKSVYPDLRQECHGLGMNTLGPRFQLHPYLIYPELPILHLPSRDCTNISKSTWHREHTEGAQ